MAVLLGIVVGSAACSDGVAPPDPAEASRYLGQSPPGETPAVFAPGLVSTADAVELNGVLSPDFREFFFTRMTPAPSGDRVFRMYRSLVSEDGSWSAPEQVPVYPDNAPSLAVDMAYSPDGRRLYFLGRHPHPLASEAPGLDIAGCAHTVAPADGCHHRPDCQRWRLLRRAAALPRVPPRLGVSAIAAAIVGQPACLEALRGLAD